MSQNFQKKNKAGKGRALKIFLICALCVLAVGAALALVRRFLNKSNTEGVTYTVRQEIYENTISVAGVVGAAREQDLQALSNGTVVGVYAKQGDAVKAGDVIMQMDDTEQQYNLAKHDYEMETVRITGSRRQYALMQTQRLSLVQKIAERKVAATFDGIIADIDVSVGDSLEAKDSVGTLVDVSYLVADVEIAETDVSKLKAGQEVEFTFPACQEKVKGHVVGWPAIGEVTSRGATVVEARLRIDEYPPSILPNFSFSGKIKVAPDEKFLLVERYAVGRENRQAFVVREKDGKKINVTVMPYGGEYVKILEGDVKEGDVLKAQSAAQKSGFNRNRRMGPPGVPGAGAPRRGGF